MEQEKVQMTQEGYDTLKQEYEHLIHDVRPEVIVELAAARAQGDLSENADLDAARDRQARVEARIMELDSLLQKAEIVSFVTKKGEKKTVHMGSVVTVHDIARDRHDTYTIVGVVESDPLAGKIAQTTPMGAALIDHKVGDVVTITGIRNPYKVKIEKID